MQYKDHYNEILKAFRVSLNLVVRSVSETTLERVRKNLPSVDHSEPLYICPTPSSKCHVDNKLLKLN
jgi:hypothetical protein